MSWFFKIDFDKSVSVDRRVRDLNLMEYTNLIRSICI